MTNLPHVLIVDDDEPLARSLTDILAADGYRSSYRTSAVGLITFLDENQVDLLIIDLGLPDVDGFSAVETVRRHMMHRDIPILVLSGSAAPGATVDAFRSGANDYVAKPFRIDELLARVRTHLRTGRELIAARAQARTGAELAALVAEIGVAASPAEIFQVMVRRLARGLRVSRGSIILDDENGETATVVAAVENPALRHLTIELRRYPELVSVFASEEPLLIKNVKDDAIFSSVRELWKLEGRLVPTTSIALIPFRVRGARQAIFYLRTAGDDAPLDQEDLVFAQSAINSANPLLDKAFDFEEALRRQDEMRQLAETDPLTGLFNRRALRERLEQLLTRAERTGGVLSCLMMDIDHFKRLNDTFGHEMGDRVLVQLADLMRREQRSMDVLARLGGEEFVVLLPETGIRGARIYAERILRKVAAASISSNNQTVQITVSIGIATFPDERVTDSDSLLRLADVNLLRAKADGRNRYRD